MRAALVTGAAGLIGSHLCEAFAQAGWEVRALDKPGSDLSVAEAAGGKTPFLRLSQAQGGPPGGPPPQSAPPGAPPAVPGGPAPPGGRPPPPAPPRPP